ncbi:Uncharacterised protein [Serratia fonticola]|nr:Uncharacterised protein [Serratia fonticola]CAI1190987.1 Uncharacterised protein [Serratia fonticola]CAI1963768.1 Uncharacterised protein [Serratia fonticola]
MIKKSGNSHPRYFLILLLHSLLLSLFPQIIHLTWLMKLIVKKILPW